MFSFYGVLCGAALISALRSGFAFSTLVRDSFRCHFEHFSLVADPRDALTLSSIPCAKKKNTWRLPEGGNVPSFLASGDWFGVVLVLCLLRWVVLVFTWVVVLVEALKESDYTGKQQHTLLDRVFWGSRFVPGFGRGFGFLWVQILVFLVPSF